jgi:site-specific DNA-cytosine methylase
MAVYYNEIDPFAAQWLRNLILAGHLPRGDVDTHSIVDVQPDDLRGCTECHFFAGIGRMATRFPTRQMGQARPVWTGSCPRQPFSAVGNRKDQSHERHLWPVWFRLIRERKPSIIFGEQIALAIAHEWLDEISHDLGSRKLRRRSGSIASLQRRCAASKRQTVVCTLRRERTSGGCRTAMGTQRCGRHRERRKADKEAERRKAMRKNGAAEVPTVTRPEDVRGTERPGDVVGSERPAAVCDRATG